LLGAHAQTHLHVAVAMTIDATISTIGKQRREMV